MKRALFFIVFAAFVGFTSYSQVVEEKKATRIEMPENGLCAHRGAMETHPENTLLAFREAVKAGAQMIEFDVQLSKDGHLVVMHDASVDRTTDGSGNVADLTLREIKKLDAGSWKSPAFKGERVPTLRETLAVMPEHIWLNVHLKGNGHLSARVAKTLAKDNRLHQAFLACSAGAAAAAKKAVPGIMICNMDRKEDNADYVAETIEMKADFIQLRGTISPAFADYTRKLHAQGIKVNYYGTDSPEEIRILRDYGIDFPLVNDIIRQADKARQRKNQSQINDG